MAAVSLLSPRVSTTTHQWTPRPSSLSLPGSREHRVGLAYTGRGAEVNAQLSPWPGLPPVEAAPENVRVGSVSVGYGHGLGVI